MLYIDFDGVILDTEDLLFEDWLMRPNHHLLSEDDKIKYIQKVNWSSVLNNSNVIRDSIYYLKQMDPTKTFILTKIHSLSNEGRAKVDWLRQNDVKQSVILVPYRLKKTDMVDAKGSILIDDSLRNLDDWTNNQGEAIFFDIDDDNYDSWQQFNEKGYQKVLCLEKFRNYK